MNDNYLESLIDGKAMVNRCATWLDKAHPGWHKKIDIPTLDISSCCNCVLGQVCGYMEGIYEAKGMASEDNALMTQNDICYSFAVESAQPHWLSEIQSRLDADKESEFISRTNEIINLPAVITSGRELVSVKEEVNG